MEQQKKNKKYNKNLSKENKQKKEVRIELYK